jgi:hypothetical protein
MGSGVIAHQLTRYVSAWHMQTWVCVQELHAGGDCAHGLSAQRAASVWSSLVVSSSHALCRLTGVGVTVCMSSAASTREATMYPTTVRYLASYLSAVQAGCCCGHCLHVFCFMHRRLDACVQVDTAPDALVLSRRMAWLLVVGCAASALHGLGEAHASRW